MQPWFLPASSIPITSNRGEALEMNRCIMEINSSHGSKRQIRVYIEVSFVHHLWAFEQWIVWNGPKCACKGRNVFVHVWLKVNVFLPVRAWSCVRLSNSVCVKWGNDYEFGCAWMEVFERGPMCVSSGGECDCVLIRSQWHAKFRPRWDSCSSHIPIAFPIWQLMRSQTECASLNCQQYTCQLNFSSSSLPLFPPSSFHSTPTSSVLKCSPCSVASLSSSLTADLSYNSQGSGAVPSPAFWAVVFHGDCFMVSLCHNKSLDLK